MERLRHSRDQELLAGNRGHQDGTGTQDCDGPGTFGCVCAFYYSFSLLEFVKFANKLTSLIEKVVVTQWPGEQTKKVHTVQKENKFLVNRS